MKKQKLQKSAEGRADEKLFRKEISRSLLLDEKEKQFWLDQAATLPDILLKNILQLVQSKNQIVDEYLFAALKNDPDHQYLANLKAKIKKIKAAAFIIDESADKEDADENLKKQIQNLGS